MNRQDNLKNFKFPTYSESEGGIKRGRSFSSRLQKNQTSSSFSLGDTPFQRKERKRELSKWPVKKEFPRTTPAIKTFEPSSQTSVQKRFEGYNRTSYKASRYTPTKIPAPIAPKPKVEVITKGELLSSMKKAESTYLLFSKHTWVEEESLKRSVEESIIPKSLIEEEIEKPAVTKKGKKARTKNALDKSLKGIFEEEQTPFFNRYFEK